MKLVHDRIGAPKIDFIYSLEIIVKKPSYISKSEYNYRNTKNIFYIYCFFKVIILKYSVISMMYSLK